MGVMSSSSLRTNRPRLTASVIVLNNVSVVPNDSAPAYISVVVAFEDCAVNTVKCLNLKLSEEAQETEYDN